MFIFLTAFLLLLGVYCFVRLILPFGLSWLGNILAFLLVVGISQYLPLSRWMSMSAWGPSIPISVHVLGSVLLGTLLLLVLALIFRDLLWLIGKLFGGFFAFRFGRGQATLWIGVFFCLGLYSGWQAVQVPIVRHVEIAVPNLPSALEGFRIAQISDLHIGPVFRQQWVAQVVQRSNAARPDLVVLTGDLADGDPAQLAKDIAPLADLKAPYGVLVGLGNHEYYSGFVRWMEAYMGLGLNILENSHVLLDVAQDVHGKGTQGSAESSFSSVADTAQLAVVGISDPVAASFGLEVPDARKAMEGIPPEVVRLMLGHRPDSASEHAALGVDIQLSGHTHGGLLVPFMPIVAAFNGGFVRGLYKVEDMSLYVSAGAGMWGGFLLRLGVPPEISMIVLKKA